MGGWLRGIRTSSSRSRSRIASGRICASWRAERVRAHCSAGPRAGRALRARPGEMKEKRGALRALFGGGEGVSGCGEGGAGEGVGLRGRWDICRRERKGKLRAFERSWAPQGNHESRTQAARVVHESAADEEGTSAAECDEGSDELTNSARDSAGCQRADPCRVEDQERAAGPEDSTWIAKTRGSFQEGEGTRRVRVAALQHPARSPPLDGRGEEQTEAVEGAAGAGDPPREVVELALASQEGRRVRGAVLRGRTPERAADLADDPLHPEQRPQARIVAGEGPARSLLVRTLVPALEDAGHLPAAAEVPGRGVEQHRLLHPVHRHRRGARPSLAGARASRYLILVARVARRGFNARDGRALGGRSSSKDAARPGAPRGAQRPLPASRRLSSSIARRRWAGPLPPASMRG